MTARTLGVIAGLGVVVAVGGIVLWVASPGTAGRIGLALAIAGGFVALGSIIPLVARPGVRPRPPEPDDLGKLSDERLRELMRGTSLYLREMRYRYSVRMDSSGASDRRLFSAEVNTIHLGFVPAVITDNSNDRQGYGFVAFVYDGKRWRGPGLPCPADQAEAVRHAARCVSPLAKEEETTIGW